MNILTDTFPTSSEVKAIAESARIKNVSEFYDRVKTQILMAAQLQETKIDLALTKDKLNIIVDSLIPKGYTIAISSTCLGNSYQVTIGW